MMPWRTFTGLAGVAVDAMLSQHASTAGKEPSTSEREALLAALNGILANPARHPKPARHSDASAPARTASATGKGTSGRGNSPTRQQVAGDGPWSLHERPAVDTATAQSRQCLGGRPGMDTGLLALQQRLAHLHKWARLCRLLEALVAQWPMPVSELAIIGHSVGGLLARSAQYYGTKARHRWPKFLRWLVFLGTPTQDSALERIGNGLRPPRLAPYPLAATRIAAIRSAGITDCATEISSTKISRHRPFPPCGRPPPPVPIAETRALLGPCSQQG